MDNIGKIETDFEKAVYYDLSRIKGPDIVAFERNDKLCLVDGMNSHEFVKFLLEKRDFVTEPYEEKIKDLEIEVERLESLDSEKFTKVERLENDIKLLKIDVKNYKNKVKELESELKSYEDELKISKSKVEELENELNELEIIDAITNSPIELGTIDAISNSPIEI